MPNLDASKLNDYQLYALFRNKKLAKELRLLVDAEFELRNFTLDHRYELAVEYERKTKEHGADDRPPPWKFIFFLIPVYPLVCGIIEYMYRGRWNESDRRRHIRCTVAGFAVWIIAFLLFTRYSSYKHS
jgi:hypothetical protein